MITAKAITVSSVVSIRAVDAPTGRKSDHLERVCSRGPRVAAIFIGLRNVTQDKRPVGTRRWQSRALILLREWKSCITSNRLRPSRRPMSELPQLRDAIEAGNAEYSAHFPASNHRWRKLPR